MQGSRAWNRREFSVAPVGWFTVLKPTGWFAPWRQRVDTRRLATQSRTAAALREKAPDHSAAQQTTTLQFAEAGAQERRLARTMLIASVAAAITAFLLWRIIRA
jgi:hypothetical protein